MRIKSTIFSGFVTLLTFFIFLPSQSLKAAETAQAQANGIIAFVNVHVIPMDIERVMENQTVIVTGDRITTIGPVDVVAIPDDAEIIEGNGAYLMPGLADMHVHLDFDPDPASLQLYLANGVTTVRSLNTVPEQLAWRDQVNNGDLLGPTIYSSGRTIVGVPGEYAQMVRLSRLLVVVAPLIIGLVIWLFVWLLARFTSIITNFGPAKRLLLPSLAGLLLVGMLLYFVIPLTTFMQMVAGPTITVPESENEARQMVREQYEAGVDFIKPYNFLPREHYFAVMDEANRLGLYTAGHTTAYPEVVSVQEMLAAGQDEVVHADEFTHYFWVGYDPDVNEWVEYDIDMSHIDDVAALVAEADMAVTPTLITNDMALLGLEDTEGLLSQPQYEVIRPETMETWRQGGRFVRWQGQQTYRRDNWRVLLVELTRAFNEHGVLINVGTDVSVEGVIPGYAVHQELLRLVEAGLTNFEALAAGTRNPGITVERMVGQGNFGTVVTGNRADLILLPNNPLEDVSYTQERLGVMVRGTWFSQAELDGLTDALIASYTDAN